MKRSKRNAKWIENHCKVPEGPLVGKQIKLYPAQLDVLVGIYDSPTRLVIVSFGRKNGKTSTAAMLLLLHLVGPEAQRNSQLYSTATSRNQAAVLFELAAKMVRMSSSLSEYITVRDSVKELLCPELGTFYKALSSEAPTAHGLSPIFVIHDELGRVRGSRSPLYEALETATGAHEEPLSIIISTQAETDDDLLSVLIDDALSGKASKTKLFFWTAPIEDDPFCEQTWRKANPMYGYVLNPEIVRDQAERAKRMPSRENAFRNLVLNQRINQTSSFISRNVWLPCGGEPDRDVFRDSPVYVGLDLSARHDLTALVMVAEDEDRVWHVLPEFFAPSKGLIDRARRDRVPYDLWVDQGFITTTPGASVDYEIVAARLVDLCDKHSVEAIAFDRWRIDVFRKELSRLGAELPLVPHGQGYKDMSPAIDSLESAIANEKIAHGNNPVLTWCAANAVVTTDPAGNRKLDKSKTTGRIDGIVALAMAIGTAHAQPGKTITTSVYEQGVI